MDELEELKELALHYARGIWKHRWIAIGVAWLVMLVGVAFVDKIENQYTAETKVYIDSTSVLGPLLKGIAVQSDFQSVVNLMVRQLLSRPNLERAVRALDLDLEVSSPREMERLIASIRKRLDVSSRGRNGIYTISYTDTDRDKAQQMVQVLLDIFVEDTLGSTIDESDNAIEFLNSQIERYEALLLEAEKRREDFKRRNIGLMPQDGTDYFRQLQEALNVLEQTELTLSEMRNRRDRIRQQITELENNEVRSETLVKTNLDARIEEQENRLDELLLLYTDEHPDVINGREVLSQLQQRKEKEAEQIISTSTLLDNPVYQELQISLSKTEADISSVSTRVLSLKRKAEELRERIDIVPQIEAEMQRLNRDYEIHKQNYNQFVARREKARISDEAETGGEQVKFRIIEPPYVPFKPQYPNRPLLDFGVLIMAIGIGYGISLLISLFQPIFYNPRDLIKNIGGSVLGGISKFDTPKVLSKRRRNFVLFGMANLLLLCTVGVLILLHSRGTLILSRLQQLMI